jgi:hypothetical protein
LQGDTQISCRPATPPILSFLYILTFLKNNVNDVFRFKKCGLPSVTIHGSLWQHILALCLHISEDLLMQAACEA